MRSPDIEEAAARKGVATLCENGGSEKGKPSRSSEDHFSHTSESLAMLPPGTEARCALMRRWRQSYASRSYWGYLEASNLLPIGFTPTSLAQELGLTLTPIRFWRDGRFAFADERDDAEAVPGVVIECRDPDREIEKTVDLVAWRQDDPSVVASYLGRVGLLGSWNLSRAMQYVPALKIQAHPLAWLQADGMVGAAIVDLRLAAPQIRMARQFGPVAMPNVRLAEQIRRLDKPPHPMLAPKAA